MGSVGQWQFEDMKKFVNQVQSPTKVRLTKVRNDSIPTKVRGDRAQVFVDLNTVMTAKKRRKKRNKLSYPKTKSRKKRKTVEVVEGPLDDEEYDLIDWPASDVDVEVGTELATEPTFDFDLVTD